MTHHPHIHMIVPGGGIARDGQGWISSRPAFLLPVRVLGKLFRRLFLTGLLASHAAGRLAFYGSMAHLTDCRAFLRHLSPVRKKRWVVYAKPPFAGPEAVLTYLSRYTHRVVISNSRLLRFDHAGVTFRYKDYRRDGADRQQIMTLAADEFMPSYGGQRSSAAYTQKIHKTIVDIQNQLLGIPVATIVVASQMRAPTTCGPERLVNHAVVVGAWIFVVMLIVAIVNQWLTLNVIRDAVTKQQSTLGATSKR